MQLHRNLNTVSVPTNLYFLSLLDTYTKTQWVAFVQFATNNTLTQQTTLLATLFYDLQCCFENSTI